MHERRDDEKFVAILRLDTVRVMRHHRSLVPHLATKLFRVAFHDSTERDTERLEGLRLALTSKSMVHVSTNFFLVQEQKCHNLHRR
jgi:hypothetical protein